MQIQLKNPANPNMWAVYFSLKNRFSEENASESEPKGTASQYLAVIVSPTSFFYNQRHIQETATQWKDSAKGFIAANKSLNESTIADIPSYLPDLEKDIIEYATRNKISIMDLVNYYRQIYAVFSGVEKVKVSLVSDHEIENYKKIRYHFKIKSSVETVLEKEVEFNKSIRKTISRDSRIHFALTPQIV
jgi:hypothetical protein